MERTKGLIFFAISLAVLITGCGRSTPGYAISRIGNMVTVFTTMQDASEIVDVRIDNNTLKLHIDTGDSVEERVIPLQIGNINIGKHPEQPKRTLPVAAPYETLEIQGTNKINRYGVVHLKITVSDPEMKAKMPQAPLFLSVLKSRGGWTLSGIREKSTLANSGAFRLGDRITAYCLSQGGDVDRHKVPRITYRDVEINEGDRKNRILKVETYDATDVHKVKMIRRLQFLLKDLEDHETVSIKEITNLGEEIIIAVLEVLPKENGSIKHNGNTGE